MTTINGCKAQNKENKDSLQQKIEKIKMIFIKNQSTCCGLLVIVSPVNLSHF